MALLKYIDDSVMAFLTSMDGFVLALLKCIDGSVLALLSFPQSVPTRIPQTGILLTIAIMKEKQQHNLLEIEW